MAGQNLIGRSLADWLWEAACVIRGPIDAPKFKDYILPLIFMKRVSDVFEDELGELGDIARYVDGDHSLVRFYIPPNYRWDRLSQMTTALGETLTDAIRALEIENDKLKGVFGSLDFNATAAGQRILSDEQLRALIRVLSRYRLGLKDVEPDVLGDAYMELIKKFAEGQGQSAGEFFTPTSVTTLMAHILDPEPGDEIYDPACGSGGLLIKSHLRFRQKYNDDLHIAPLQFFGQEINPATYSMTRMNTFIHDMGVEIVLGDTMNRPGFQNPDSTLQQFHKVTANPMWNQDFPVSTYEHDLYGRFDFGYPPGSSADWGWVQHMYASLKDGGN